MEGKISPFQSRKIVWAWIFLTPSLLILSFSAAFPLFRTIWYSFTNIKLDSLEDYQFVNFENYEILFTDPLWWQSVWNTIIFVTVSVSLELVLGMIVALFLFHEFQGRKFVIAAVLVPWAIPTVVSSQIWVWLFHDQYGLINDILFDLGIFELNEPISFMNNPFLALPIIIAVDIWKATPFLALLFLAGLSSIPKNLLEVCKLNGANPFQTFFLVQYPFLKPYILIALILRSLDAFRVFDVIYIMQGNNKHAASISIYARQQMIDFQELGLGSAASVAIFILISIFTVGYFISLKGKLSE